MTHGTMALGRGVGVIHTIPGTRAITGDLIIIAVGAGAGTEDHITATADVEVGILFITEAADIPHILTEEVAIQQAIMLTEIRIDVLTIFPEIIIIMEELVILLVE